jgi:hypothetical protein
MLPTYLASAVDLSHPGHYLTWGVISVSVANAVVVLVMLALFALAIWLPFPGGKDRS